MKWFTSEMGFNALMALNTFNALMSMKDRQYLFAATIVALMAGMYLLQRAREYLAAKRDFYGEKLHRARVQREMTEKMAAEMERAIATGRVHFSAEHHAEPEVH